MQRQMIAALLISGLTLLAQAEEAVVTLRSTVTGNQEQPRVMYILPWQQPESSVIDYDPGARIAAELFREIERDAFVRELHYRDLLAGNRRPMNEQ